MSDQNTTALLTSQLIAKEFGVRDMKTFICLMHNLDNNLRCAVARLLYERNRISGNVDGFLIDLKNFLILLSCLSELDEGLEGAHTDGTDVMREVSGRGGELQGEKGRELLHLASVVLPEVQVGRQDIRGQAEPAPGRLHPAHYSLLALKLFKSNSNG